MTAKFLLPVTLLVASASAQAQATPMALTQEQALTRLFSAAELQAEWFTPEFLKQAPLATIQAQLQGIAAQYGKFVRMATLQGHPQAVYERGSLIVTSAPLDSQGRLSSFGAVAGPNPNMQTLTPEQEQAGIQVLQKLLGVEPLDTTMFSPDFLQHVSAEDLKQSFGALRSQLGALQDIQASESGWDIQFAGGTLPVTALELDAQGQISSFRIGAPSFKFANIEEAQAAFAALGGQVSLLVQEAGQAPLVALNSGRLLGIGSAFKLGILSELQAQVKAGKLNWTDQITLLDAMKSLPSGTLQDAPAGTQYTLQDLATRMIRDSDNTATDLLLQKVGREGVEARLGQSAIPSTREFFALKNPANLELLRAYRAAGLNVAARRDVLAQAASAPLPSAALFGEGKTLARDVEWFVSTERLCRLMSDVAALPEMQINAGVANKNDFERVSYKGGSEVGVLNLTTQVTNKAGKTYCVSATWNDAAPLNEAEFLGLYAGVLALLK
ncbi:serine hydrolase [Deinococcus xinjiangensis]